MQIRTLKIENFRGIRSASILLPKHAVLIGDNNTGKTSLLEAIDLTLGPDRLNRVPPVDEHDFFEGKYRSYIKVQPQEEGAVESEAEHQDEDPAPEIIIEVTVVDLSEEQIARFGDHIEWWDEAAQMLYAEHSPEGVDAESISEAIRVSFVGRYDEEEDDFDGRTYFSRTLLEAENPTTFTKKDKQVCGFLYLRSLRTGSRALSLERGSLLDIILRLKEVRPQMWEETIGNLADYAVASEPALGITGVLTSINSALKKYVPKEWGGQPHLKVSNLTRDHLRKVITAFIATGEGSHAAPFYRQGTGTINMLVLAMLSLIAKDKQNVIFAMEEPETAIPPYAQKRIVHEIRQLASQTLFTSHSPYVLEEFEIGETVVLSRDSNGSLGQSAIELPDSVKMKRYRQEFRTRFCEGLLARRILVAEGATEAAAFPVVCRRLAELRPDIYTSLEAMGICTVDAGGETNIPDMAKVYSKLGKRVFSICDRQSDEHKTKIEQSVEMLFMHPEIGFEDLVLNNTTLEALIRFASLIYWPQHIAAKYPDIATNPIRALSEYFSSKKADWGVADFLAQCTEDEIPQWLRETAKAVKALCDPQAVERPDQEIDMALNAADEGANGD